MADTDITAGVAAGLIADRSDSSESRGGSEYGTTKGALWRPSSVRPSASHLCVDEAGSSANKKPHRSGASTIPDGSVAYFFFVCFWLPLR